MMLKKKQLQVQIAKMKARLLEMDLNIYEYEEKIKNLEENKDIQEKAIKELEIELNNL